jgi:hypothetical protein
MHVGRLEQLLELLVIFGAVVLAILVALFLWSRVKKAYHWDNAGWTPGKVILVGIVVLLGVLFAFH